MTPQEFVKQVLSLQEQVYLDDFYPTDDVYKMVLLNANIALQEFQDENQWTFLRKRMVLGTTEKQGPNDHTIPEFMLPEFVHRVSTLYEDRLTLHDYDKKCCKHGDVSLNDIDNSSFIEVPYISRGAGRHGQYDYGSNLNWYPYNLEPLKALVFNKLITFNRELHGDEVNKAAVIDYQEEIPLLHICNDSCKDKDGNTPDYANNKPCTKIEKSIFNYMPYADYIVLKTATYNAEGSEIAQDKAMKLADRAKTRLSKIREADSEATDVDQVEFTPFNILVV